MPLKVVILGLIALALLYILLMFIVNIGGKAYRHFSSVREERQDLERRETLLLETATKVEQLLRATDERVKELKSLEK